MKPHQIQRLEGTLLFLLTFYIYSGPWWLFAVLFMAPDIGLAGKFINSRVGAHAYNFFHTVVMPVILGSIGLFLGMPLLVQIAIIWFSHINFDRMLGFGLKNPDAVDKPDLAGVSP